jgi:hypothetical protein
VNTRLKTIFIVAVVVAAILVVAVATLRTPQATYQNQTVDRWLAQVFTTNRSVAFQAFREMGTNALPDLARNLVRKETIEDRFYAWGYFHLPLKWQRPAWKPFPIRERWGAAMAVLTELLDPRPIFPQLMEMIADKNNGARDYVAVVVLSTPSPIDVKYVPLFKEMLLDTNVWIRRHAPSLLERMGTNAASAIPDLNRALQDSDLGVRISSARALWQIARLTNGIPALHAGLNAAPVSNNPNLGMISAVYLHEIDKNDPAPIPVFTNAVFAVTSWGNVAIRSLGDFGPAAKSAVPMLKIVIERNLGEKSREALISLKKIDPEAAAKYDKP